MGESGPAWGRDGPPTSSILPKMALTRSAYEQLATARPTATAPATFAVPATWSHPTNGTDTACSLLPWAYRTRARRMSTRCQTAPRCASAPHAPTPRTERALELAGRGRQKRPLGGRRVAQRRRRAHLDRCRPYRSQWGKGSALPPNAPISPSRPPLTHATVPLRAHDVAPRGRGAHGRRSILPRFARRERTRLRRKQGSDRGQDGRGDHQRQRGPPAPQHGGRARRRTRLIVARHRRVSGRFHPHGTGRPKRPDFHGARGARRKRTRACEDGVDDGGGAMGKDGGW